MIRTTAPLAIAHQEQFPSVTLSFNLAPGAALGDAGRYHLVGERVIGHAVLGDRQLFGRLRRKFAKSLRTSRG
jgi:hypothetical protein